MCDRHPPFDNRRQGDRALRVSDHARAVAMADELARKDGLRRRVVQHHGRFVGTAWLVQKVDRARIPTAEEEVRTHNAALALAALVTAGTVYVR